MTLDVKTILQSKLFPYQIKWIQDRSKYAICEKSRRIGLTWSEAIAAVIYSLSTGENCWFSSSDETNSKEYIRYVIECCEVINAALGIEYINLKTATTEVVYLPNGSRICAISSAPKALRGKDGRITLDEFALHEQQEELYRAAQGCVIQRGCLRIISTHNGPATLFYRLVNDSPSNGFSLHRVTLEDACNEGYAIKFASHLRPVYSDPKELNQAFLAEVRAGCVSEDAYKQEFCCEPLSLQSLITPNEYDALTFDETKPEWSIKDTLDPNRKYGNLYVGIDVGRTVDYTVAWVLEELVNPKAKGQWDRYDYRTVAIHPIKNKPINIQYEQIKPLLSHKSISGITIDQGTVGRTLADLIKDDFPFVNLISFSNPKKAELAERLKGFVQYQRISLPKDQLIRSDLLSLRRMVSEGGTITYGGSSGETHCDFAWACAMAIDSAVRVGGVILVGPSQKRETKDQMEEALL